MVCLKISKYISLFLLSSTNKHHYHPAPKVLLSLGRSLHLGGAIFQMQFQSILVQNLKYLDIQNLQYPIFSYIYIGCLQRQENILRCNLLFGLIGHFGISKYINTYSFLSYCHHIMLTADHILISLLIFQFSPNPICYSNPNHKCLHSMKQCMKDSIL